MGLQLRIPEELRRYYDFSSVAMTPIDKWDCNSPALCAGVNVQRETRTDPFKGTEDKFINLYPINVSPSHDPVQRFPLRKQACSHM